MPPGTSRVTARFFMERVLPETATHLARIEAGAGSLMEVPDDSYRELGLSSRRLWLIFYWGRH
ncbi:MAG: acyl-CoA dehydrogenase C-terminal domain-containing protein [Pseudolabrys sp.]